MRLRGEAHGLAGRGAGLPRRGDGPAPGSASPDGVTGRRLHPHRPAVLRRRRQLEPSDARSARLARGAPDGGRALGRAGHRLAAARLRADALVGQGRGPAADQYAAVGAAARAALPAAVDVLDRRPRAGRRRRRRCRDRTAAPGRATPRRSPPPTAATAGRCDGLDGVRLAPFQILATEGAVYHERDHAWHLALPTGWPRPTRSSHARPGGCASTPPTRTPWRPATAWWEELTAAGGEGMVVKPHAGLTRAAAELWSSRASSAGAGSTCGSSTAPTTPSRPTWPAAGPRPRPQAVAGAAGVRPGAGGPGPVRARRAAVAGARGVFGVLALESEPVDPRL